MMSLGSRCRVVSLLLLGALGAGCGTGFNKSPVVQEGPVASEKDVASGTEVQMHLVVTDADGDPLSFKWLQTPEEPGGSFSDITVAEPSWVAPEVTAPQRFTLEVIIMDPDRATLLSFTSIQVHPRK
jgi:hypothetical protein